MSQILTGIELPCEAQIGRRFKIEHFSDIIISDDASFGDDVIIRDGVTVGLSHTGIRGAPKIGTRVDIGAGAKILGAITIGDEVAIGSPPLWRNTYQATRSRSECSPASSHAITWTRAQARSSSGENFSAGPVFRLIR